MSKYYMFGIDSIDGKELGYIKLSDEGNAKWVRNWIMSKRYKKYLGITWAYSIYPITKRSEIKQMREFTDFSESNVYYI